MTKSKKLLIFSVGLMKEFHQNRANRTHPMVLGSSIGMFLMITFLLIGVFVNTHIASPLGTDPNSLDYLPRYAPQIFVLCIFILIFNMIAFKLSLQGKQYGFMESIVHFFSEKKDIHSKLRKSYSWKVFWNSGDEQSAKEKFISYIKEIEFTEKDLQNSQAQEKFHDLMQDTDTVYQHDFDNFIQFLYTDVCEQNTRDVNLDKCAVFFDVNNFNNEESKSFKEWVFSSNYMFIHSNSSALLSISELTKRVINLIPYLILTAMSLMFFKMNYNYATDNFATAQLQMILTLEMFCLFAIFYAVLSFYFLRKTEDWREYWNKYGLQFMLLFHQRGVNKVPAYILPDTEFYNPKEYYKIFEACNHFNIHCLYDDKRNMFYDNSQYYFLIIYNQINQSYDIDIIKKTMLVKKHKPVIFKEFQSF